MTVLRATGVLALAVVLASCSSGTAAPSVSVSTVPGVDYPAPPGSGAAKYHDARSLCDAVSARPVKGFTPTHMEVTSGSDMFVMVCTLTDDSQHKITVTATRGDDQSASVGFDESAKGGTPVSGIGDKAALIGTDVPVLSVLKETNTYTLSAIVDGDQAAVVKDIALAIV